MQIEEFKLRRDWLLSEIGDRGIAIVFAAKEHIRSGKESYPYRQHSDFYYLTGFTEPESIAVFVPGRKEGEFVLFSRQRDEKKELWTGLCVGQDGACREFGANQAFPIVEAAIVLPKLLAGRDHVYFNDDCDHGFSSKVNDWAKQADINSHNLINIGKVLHDRRLKKSQSELVLMRRAAEITAEGYLRAMRKCRPGIYEFELESELLYEFMRLGGRYEAFKTIVGSGANSCTLHYSKNASKLADGDLVLVDAGVEYEYYCADVTRTFPVNGKFTDKQRAIYEAVLEAQLEVIKQVRPGIRFNSLQMIAERVITEKLVCLGLLKGRIDDLLVSNAFKPFFMHKFGHWLGLDVHDVGEYDILEPGMVLTVEPGIYIASDNVGVRIEDDVLVTENGCDILTKAIPKTIPEIEKIMGGCK